MEGDRGFLSLSVVYNSGIQRGMHMNAAADREATAIIEELNRIRRELEGVALELKGLKGISVDYCSRRLTQISSEYSEVVQMLYRLR